MKGIAWDFKLSLLFKWEGLDFKTEFNLCAAYCSIFIKDVFNKETFRLVFI